MKKYRKKVHCPSNRDKVCPNPNPYEESNTAHPTVIGPDIMVREECDMQGPSCQSSTISSTCSKEIKKEADRSIKMKTVNKYQCEN